jgi:hypothetical protein
MTASTLGAGSGLQAIDPSNPLILHAGVRGGGLGDKTIDGGTTWTASSAGIPTRAGVSVAYVSPQDPATVFAATDRGRDETVDGGTAWALAGFLGRSVLDIARSGAAPSPRLVDQQRRSRGRLDQAREVLLALLECLQPRRRTQAPLRSCRLPSTGATRQKARPAPAGCFT